MKYDYLFHFNKNQSILFFFESIYPLIILTFILMFEHSQSSWNDFRMYTQHHAGFSHRDFIPNLAGRPDTNIEKEG